MGELLFSFLSRNDVLPNLKRIFPKTRTVVSPGPDGGLIIVTKRIQNLNETATTVTEIPPKT